MSQLQKAIVQQAFEWFIETFELEEKMVKKVGKVFEGMEEKEQKKINKKVKKMEKGEKMMGMIYEMYVEKYIKTIVVKKTTMKKKVEVPQEERCCELKADGEQCKGRKMGEEKAKKHNEMTSEEKKKYEEEKNMKWKEFDGEKCYFHNKPKAEKKNKTPVKKHQCVQKIASGEKKGERCTHKASEENKVDGKYYCGTHLTKAKKEYEAKQKVNVVAGDESESESEDESEDETPVTKKRVVPEESDSEEESDDEE